MEAVLQWLGKNWGNAASVGGLVGVALAFWQLVRTRKAAEAAKDAAEETGLAIRRVLTISDIERAIALLERLKEYHRANKWEVAAALYGQVASLLADIPVKSPETLESIQYAVSQLGIMEVYVDQGLRKNQPPQDAETFVIRLLEIQQNLRAIAGQLEQAQLSG
jgi:hypothetical protein